MRCYAVIDTNVLVAALLSSHDDAATVQVVTRLIAGEITPLFDERIINEYSEVLRRERFHFPDEAVSVLLDVIEKYGELVSASPTEDILPDIKDVPFYEVVMEKQKDDAYLVTGNIKHFPKKPFIVTPRELIDILSK
ncbi:MAG TPA: putative toxin-antitoxin system toxin component, PIN family [Lachnospiraceae bacterium]|jgi:putative PIN family toxin of toxin-antitoxin system|nr:putative toxin-antitoxin system toxin component, PIN family [Lachnospiraceae bacterium]